MNGNVLVAGDTLDFLDSIPEFPASASWVMKYVLVPQFTFPAQSPITLTGVASGEDHHIQVAASVTATWKAGDYTWSRYVENSGVRQSLGSGQLEVLPDPTQLAQGFDGRSHARKMLDAIETALLALNHGVRSYSIAGRAWMKEDIADLEKMRDKYRAEVADEIAAAEMAAGASNPRVMKARFGRG